MKLMSGSTGPQATRTRLAGTLVLAVGIVSLMGAGAAADPHVGQSVNVAVVDSTGVTNGGYFPTTGGYLDDFTFTDVAVGSVNATTLMSYDTVLLNVASSGMGCDTASLTADQKNDLVDFVYNGGKLIIYDSECPAVDYSWLPYPFTTNNPGPQGEQGTLTIAEQNVLSSTDPGDPHYIDAAAVASQTDAVGDMNVMTTLDPAWCLDMTGTNATPATGPVHTYARYGNGLFIYNGFDVDDMPSGDVPNGLQKTWIQELQAPFNPSPEADLPCGIPVVGPPARVDSTQKGSLLVYPKVELRWDAAGNMIQDTFVDITNDYPGSVEVQMYFVNGDPALDAVYDDITGDLVERAHPGCNWVDNLITLTGNEPAFWSALTGLEKGVSPFTVLDPTTGAFNPADPLTWPGRPAQDGTDERVLRGFVVAWAVDTNNEEIRWNHLKGDALLVNYDAPGAWEYNAYAFQIQSVAHGEPSGTPGELRLDGTEYAACFDYLMLDFYASGADALTGGPDVEIEVDTDLTLLPMLIDLRQDGEGDLVTKAKFDIWNQNEVKFSGTERCVYCWDQTLLSMYEIPNHFLRQHLQTNKGKARIDGMASIVCGDLEQPPGGRSMLSVDAPLLGVAAKVLDFYTSLVPDRGYAGMTLVGMGEQPGVLRYDLLAPPPEQPLVEPPAEAQAAPARAAESVSMDR